VSYYKKNKKLTKLFKKKNKILDTNKLSVWRYTVYGSFPHGIRNGIEYWHFSRYRIKVVNSTIVTTVAISYQDCMVIGQFKVYLQTILDLC